MQVNDLKQITRSRSVPWLVFAVPMLFLGVSNTQAAETQTFCITGVSNNVGWQIGLSAPGDAAVGLPAVVDEDQDATQLALAFVTRINLGDINHPFSARFICTAEDGTAYFSVTGPDDFIMSVAEENGANPCIVTGNPAGCAFNPTIVDVATLENFDLVCGKCSSAECPTVSTWGLAVFSILLLIAGTITATKSHRTA